MLFSLCSRRLAFASLLPADRPGVYRDIYRDIRSRRIRLSEVRAGFGVGAKADLLAFLLGLEGAYATTREAAEATSYTEVAVRTAAQRMVQALFVREDPEEQPARYALGPVPWAPLLGMARKPAKTSTVKLWPAWRDCTSDWADVFAFFADLLEWARTGRDAQWSVYVWSSRARDVAEKEAFAVWVYHISQCSRDHV